MKKKSRMAAVAAVLLGAALLASAAFAAKLLTFGTGDVSVTKDGQVSIVNDTGEYGGVYLKNHPSKRLDKVHFSFLSNGDVQGGAPRFSIAIDTDGNRKTTEGYAFMDVANCGGTVGDNPDLDITQVSTDNENCRVFFGSGAWDNWAAFVAANPTWRTSHDQAFVIADVEGSYHVWNVRIVK